MTTYFGTFLGGIWGRKEIFRAEYFVGFSGGKVKNGEKWLKETCWSHTYTPQK
jgi:hypothetical protein